MHTVVLTTRQSLWRNKNLNKLSDERRDVTRFICHLDAGKHDITQLSAQRFSVLLTVIHSLMFSPTTPPPLRQSIDCGHVVTTANKNYSTHTTRQCDDTLDKKVRPVC